MTLNDQQHLCFYRRKKKKTRPEDRMSNLLQETRNKADRFQKEAICLTCLVALETWGLWGWQPVVRGVGSRVRDTSWHWSPGMKLPKWAEPHLWGEPPSERIFPSHTRPHPTQQFGMLACMAFRENDSHWWQFGCQTDAGPNYSRLSSLTILSNESNENICPFSQMQKKIKRVLCVPFSPSIVLK